MTDLVRYQIPLGPLGTIAHALIVKRDIAAIFDYRFSRIAERFGSVKWPESLSLTTKGLDHATGQNV